MVFFFLHCPSSLVYAHHNIEYLDSCSNGSLIALCFENASPFWSGLPQCSAARFWGIGRLLEEELAMFGPKRSLLRCRLRLILEELESRTLLSASIVDTLRAAPQAILNTTVQGSVSADPQRRPGGGGGGGGGGSTNPPGYSPSQIQNAYGFNNITFSNGTKGDASGQNIAIVDAYNDATIWKDLTTFDTQYHLANPSLTVMNQSGTVLSTNGNRTGVTPPSADRSGGWEVEEALDVEWAHAMAPGANIVLVEANSNSISDLMTAVHTAANNASVVSMSWGTSEFPSETSYDSYFQPYSSTNPNGYSNPNPVTFVAASGDGGAPPIWPAVSPNVVAVGGTSLNLNGTGSYGSESGWSGSGGGISQYEQQPAGLPTSYSNGTTTGIADTQLGSGYARMSPDVAYNANPNTGYAVYDSTTYYPYYPYRFGAASGWFVVGGTSAGAPQWSALIAIADQGRALNSSNNTPLGGASQTLPALYNMSSSDFHDITIGNNGYSAGSGYDLVTGRGSPIVSSVVAALVNTTSTGNVGGLVANNGSTSSSTTAKKADVVAGDPGPSLSSSDIVALVIQAATPSEPMILILPTHTSSATIFPFGTASVLSSAFGIGQSFTVPSGFAINQGSSPLSAAYGYQFFAPAPKSISSPPAENMGLYLSPFTHESPDGVPLTGTDDADELGADGSPIPRRSLPAPLPGDIEFDLSPVFLTWKQATEAPVGDAFFVDEASMAFLAEEGLAAANGENEESWQLRGPTMVLLGMLGSTFWMLPEVVRERCKRRAILSV
jgi:subtilase family serine protease